MSTLLEHSKCRQALWSRKVQLKLDLVPLGINSSTGLGLVFGGCGFVLFCFYIVQRLTWNSKTFLLRVSHRELCSWFPVSLQTLQAKGLLLVSTGACIKSSMMLAGLRCYSNSGVNAKY